MKNKKMMCFIAMGTAALLFSCTTLPSYPIHIRYSPQHPQVSAVLKEKVVTVAKFADNRGVTDPRIIGTRVDSEGKEIPFVSSKGRLAANVTKAFKAYFFNRGYTVRGESPDWDLNPQNSSPKWGDLVVGGSIEELSVEVKTYVRTHYECKIKLRVVIADVKEKRNLYTEKIELSSSYKGAVFRLKTAERMINDILAEAIERTLADLDKG